MYEVFVRMGSFSDNETAVRALRLSMSDRNICGVRVRVRVKTRVRVRVRVRVESSGASAG